jgi:hypothetical protein
MENSRLMDGMTPGELTELQRIHDLLLKAMDQELWQLAQAMVSKRDDQLFGPGEFEIRDRVLRMGAQALEATVNDRKKGGIKVPARSVRSVAKTPASSSGGTRRS